MEKNYKLYVEREDEWERACAKDYFIDEPVTVQTVKEGIILPPMTLTPGGYTDSVPPPMAGGVCDSEGAFISGHIMKKNARVWGNLLDAYPIMQEIPYYEETVVYGGVLFNHFGHLITDGLSRLWWIMENIDCGYKFVFLWHSDSNRKSSNLEQQLLDFLQLIGIPDENIIVLEEATRFASIIVPDQTLYLKGGYKEKAILVYNAIRDSVIPAKKEKIYITRSKLAKKQIINEEFFEKFYEALGYDIVAIEQFPIREQVAIMAGAKEVVTSSGTTLEQVLFCHDEVKVTILNRTATAYFNEIDCWVHKLRKARFTFVDVAVSPLQSIWVRGIQLFMPTIYWNRYIKDCGYSANTDEKSFLLSDDIILEYIKAWAQNTVLADPFSLQGLRRYTLADILIGLNQLFSHKLDGPTLNKLRILFPSQGEAFKEKNMLRLREHKLFFNSLQQKVRDIL